MRKLLAATMCVVLLLFLPGTALSGEEELKVLVVFNFLKFVEWPATQGQLTLGTFGNDPLGRSLGSLNGRKIGDRSVSVKALKRTGEVRSVNCLYIGPSQTGDLNRVLGTVGKSPVLTVSDIPGFAEKGGALGLFRDAEHIRFSANLQTVRNSGLKVSARLLSLAKIVDPGGLKAGVIHIVMKPEEFEALTDD